MKPYMLFLACLSVALCAGPLQAAKILIASHAFPSHMFIAHEIGRELIQHGHEVYTLYDSQQKDPEYLRNMGFNILW